LRLQRLVYRAHNPRWAFQPDSGAGAAFHGGRFNRVGLPALYTSLRLETAWLEAQQAFVFKAQPMTMCAYRVDCDGIVDLTDPKSVAALGVAPSDLACAWEDLIDKKLTPPTWTIADRLIASGSAGVLVPSFARGATPADVNAVFWSWSNSVPHQVKVIDDEGRLPKDASAWH
jgi:RES domain-containing protein